MEGLPQGKKLKGSTSSGFSIDHNAQRPEEIPVKKEDNGMNPVMEAIQSKIEMEKKDIREQLIASAIARRLELEAEVKMELENQRMGMRRFLGPYVDHPLLMGCGFLGSPYGHYFDGNLFTLGPSDDISVEKMKLSAHPVSGVDDFLKFDQRPHGNNQLQSGEKLETQDMVLGKWPFERDLGLVAAQIAGRSIAESGKEQELVQAKPSSSITGVKRKAETSAGASDAETASIASKGSQKKWCCSLCEVSATCEGAFNLHLQGKKHKARVTKSESSDAASCLRIESFPMKKSSQLKEPSAVTIIEQEKTTVSSKWHCSLCQVFVNSETLLKSHLQGRKHKSKKAKLELSQNSHNMETNSDKKSQGVGEQGHTNATAEGLKEWYCSLCQVSTLSEKNLNDHLNGKKHKAKEGMLHLETSDADSNLTDKVSELVENGKESLEGAETTKKEQENSNITPQIEHEQETEQKMTDKLGVEKIDFERHSHPSYSTLDQAEDVNSGQTKGKKQEASLQAKMDTDKLECTCYLNEEMGMESVKYWHCQMCDEGTCDEATMASHRKSTDHMTLLCQKGGDVIVVSRMPKEEVCDGKGTQE